MPSHHIHLSSKESLPSYGCATARRRPRPYPFLTAFGASAPSAPCGFSRRHRSCADSRGHAVRARAPIRAHNPHSRTHARSRSHARPPSRLRSFARAQPARRSSPCSRPRSRSATSRSRTRTRRSTLARPRPAASPRTSKSSAASSGPACLGECALAPPRLPAPALADAASRDDRRFPLTFWRHSSGDLGCTSAPLAPPLSPRLGSPPPSGPGFCMC